MKELKSKSWLLSLLFSAANVEALTAYSGAAPSLPASRAPFGFASSTTGGASNKSAVYVVDNMADLREALTLDYARTVYVKGVIDGLEVAKGETADCQWFIENSRVQSFNFTQYVLSTDASYMATVAAAVKKGGKIDGADATEYQTLLKKMNGWRPQVQNTQKSYTSINVKGDLTLIGLNANAYLKGVGLIFNLADNVIIRNLKFNPPRDCFPAPESATSWNARYDAVTLVTSTNFWIDGNVFEDGPEPVAEESTILGLKVDRYDGLIDCEDGSDNITISHNVIANHHKSLLLGGGTAERLRDLGKMRFTFFGNRFINSQTRNPLMRFGTFYILNNLFSNVNNQAPLAAGGPKSDARQFQYNFGVYEEANAYISGNAFRQTGKYATDTTRLFSFNGLTTPTTPARVCIPANGMTSAQNGKTLDMQAVAQKTFDHYVGTDAERAIKGGLVLTCTGFGGQKMPVALKDAAAVESYVLKEAGQIGGYTS